MILATILLTFSGIGLFWAWIGYPLSLRLRIPRWSLATISRDYQPAVTFIIPAFNQQSMVLRKIRNTLSLDYPKNLLEVLVVSDGSTDRTDELVARVRDPRVRLVALPRAGRLGAIQQAVARGHGEILVFSEVNVRLEPGSLRALMRNFADHHVGGASGAVHVRRRRDGDSMGRGEALFSRYDAWVRSMESRLGSVHAADRSLWAIRRSLYNAPRNLAQSDELAFSTRVSLGNKRFVFDPAAVCKRDAPADGEREMRRRVHVTNYTLRSISEVKWYLLRRRDYMVQLLSHTVGRYLSPLYVAGLLTGTAIMIRVNPVFQWSCVAALVMILLSALGWRYRASRVGRLPFLALPAWFAAFNVASFFGLLAFLGGAKPAGATPRKIVVAPRSEPLPDAEVLARGLPFDPAPRSTPSAGAMV